MLSVALEPAVKLTLYAEQVNALCLELRKCAVPLVDSFNFSDHIVRHGVAVACGTGG